jgi:hypothetical protein
MKVALILILFKLTIEKFDIEEVAWFAWFSILSSKTQTDQEKVY